MPRHRVYHDNGPVRLIEWRADQNYSDATRVVDAVRFSWQILVLDTNPIAGIIDKPYKYLSVVAGSLVFDSDLFLADVSAEEDEFRLAFQAAKSIADNPTRRAVLFILKQLAILAA